MLRDVIGAKKRVTHFFGNGKIYFLDNHYKTILFRLVKASNTLFLTIHSR